MPNRILREWIDSESVNSLSDSAEKFFTRLIQKADDYGRFHGSAKLLRPMLYPLQLETVREANIERWIAECEKARLVRLYNSDGKPILEIIKFRQSIRAASSKFPAFDEQTHSRSAAEISQIVENQPPSKNATQMHSKCIADALLVGGVVGVVGVSVGEGEAPHHSPHLEKLQGWQLRKDLRETTDPKEIAAIKAEMKRREQAHRKPKPTTAPAAKQETQAMTIEQRKRLWDEAKKTHKI